MNLEFIASLKSIQLLSFSRGGSTPLTANKAWKNEVSPCVFSSFVAIIALDGLSWALALGKSGLHSISVVISFVEGRELWESQLWSDWLWSGCLVMNWSTTWSSSLTGHNPSSCANFAAKDGGCRRKSGQGVDGWLDFLHRQEWLSHQFTRDWPWLCWLNITNGPPTVNIIARTNINEFWNALEPFSIQFPELE